MYNDADDTVSNGTGGLPIAETDGDADMVLAYVPEAEWISWTRAKYLAKLRDTVAARELEWSINA